MYPVQSPFVRRALEAKLPVADLTPAVPGGTCSFCAAEFVTSTARNIHVMRRHADRRQAVIR